MTIQSESYIRIKFPNLLKLEAPLHSHINIIQGRTALYDHEKLARFSPKTIKATFLVAVTISEESKPTGYVNALPFTS